MRRALTRAFGAALLLLALATPRLGHAADGRPLVRVVLVAGDSPSWFDGFVKHLERELGLRGIDVAVGRSESGTRRSAGGSAPLVAADAELVVEAPSPLRPVLRFSVAPQDETATSEGTFAARARQVNLAGVPADGCALALAVAADELMRSNWPRAVPSEAPRSAAGEGNAASPPGEAAAPATTKGPGEDRRAAAEASDRAGPNVTPRSTPSREEDGSAKEAEPTAIGTGTGSGLRSALGVAAAVEAFTGGQTQLGPDVRWAVRVLPRLEAEVHGGWRRVLRHEATNGAIDGSAMIAGGALKVLVLGGARANVWFVGRADLLRVAYTGKPRDVTIDGGSGNVLGFVVAAGPRVRVALTRSFGLEGELLGGASPVATTANDAGTAAVSTNGAAMMGSLGLFLGL